ncbi:uncharacterized protein L969DRAFT_17776 [Mixia osmundae IAM 14324]|uniref:Carboxypeptidase n=1 Tax=Mixia osmundae (strain CBS 9802 / IAM 14324 / JCM 22182 / KY 12970) TaxID=764103 RepID=G7E206_MIXOS|nr:uncharacterized protein L969DRAFT_17776 [Mixia osmundae IAM 14324]KEI38698.1 hypothetical protein L969DRAFT_17776 [Mixia osmundae IAM 14324]GAA96843.1 hypothetical protein E5Q_03516 [Mixia osmundae IAM 14324]
MLSRLIVAASLAVGILAAIPSQPTYLTYTSNTTSNNITYVKNSGQCETTPGVNSYSGYVNIGSFRYFFWFFEARKNAATAPFATWVNGGPGCSSLIGLFQENGPCTVNAQGKTELNPYSWSNTVNMIYIDQPAQTGFSTGPTTVNSTNATAQPIWEFFQLFFESGEFGKYSSRQFALSSESYGGHYIPAWATYFAQQNALIKSGKLKGTTIHLETILINNAWIDPYYAYESYIEYAYYGAKRFINSTTLQQQRKAYYAPGGCGPQIQQCYKTRTNKDCSDADDYCAENVESIIPSSVDLNYVLAPANDPFPSQSFIRYLNTASVQRAIGVTPHTSYTFCSDAAGAPFGPTGDDARSFAPQLKALILSGMRITLWAGLVDANCNGIGMLNSVLAMNITGFAAAPYENLTYASNGTVYGQVREVGNFSMAFIAGAGHEVSAYRPQAALEVFQKTMAGKALA